MGGPPRFFFAAGEISGDARAAELITALQQQLGSVSVHAVGGKRVAATGATSVRDLSALHSVRFKELRARRAHWDAFRAELPQVLREANPDVVVLVQNPQLNRMVARVAKRTLPAVPVVWYMPPEIWAWDFPAWLGRIRREFTPHAHAVRDTCDAVITVHPFERDAYQPYLPADRVHLVAHPAVDYVTAAVPNPEETRRAVRTELGIGPDTYLLGLFPGSRRDEVESLFPLMVHVARKLDANCAFVSVAATAELRELMHTVDRTRVCHVPEDRAFLDVLASCDLALVASGTSTLDAAVLGIPHVVLYRLDPATYILARAFGKVDWYGLPNIIAGREICPERRNFRSTPTRVLRTVQDLLDAPARRGAIRTDLDGVRTALRGSGGIGQAAQVIAGYLPHS